MAVIINMLSKAESVKGQGVLSAYEEQVRLVRETLPEGWKVRINSRKKADIYHVHTVNPQYFIRMLCKPKDSVSVGYVHFLPETMDKSLKLPWLARKVFYAYIIRMYKLMDHLVVVNPCFIPKLEKYGISREKVTFIPNFVSDKNFYPASPAEKKALRRQYGLPEEGTVVLSVGQLQKRKGVMEFLELAEKMPDKTFAWAGGFSFGRISDGYEAIKKAMENPPANVKFLGLVERSEMNGIYQLADMLFQPSFDELFPMTILEAMCCGLPLVLRDLELYRAILDGCYLAGDSTPDFEKALRELDDPDAYAQAQRRSLEGHAYYSRGRVAALWRDYYRMVYEGGRIKKVKKRGKANA